MTDYKIEKGVPLPPGAGRKGRNKYPWYEMEVGDSCFLPDADPRAVSQAASNVARRNNGLRFATRAVTENGVKGVRVWKIADKAKEDE